MNKILEIVHRIIKNIMPEIHPGDIYEQINDIKKLVETTHIGKPTSHDSIGSRYGLNGPFHKQVSNGHITISDARQYVTIFPHYVIYGYWSKYQEHSDRHHLELSRNPWQYIETNSNITPSILLRFLKHYDEIIKKKQIQLARI